MTYGFSTFCTKQWLPLVKILIDSICLFSNYKIVVNCLNFNYNFNNNRVISKVINTNRLYSMSHIYRYKWSTLLDNPFDICAMLDADMIALPDIDNLFIENNHKIINMKYPLFAKHPHNPFKNIIHKSNLQKMIKVFTDNTPRMNYVYATGLICKNHKEFIMEVINSIDIFHNNKICPYFEDEGILNCLLTKYQVSEDLGYNHFPNSTLLNDYINNNLNSSKELYETYTQNNCDVKFYLLHGCKNPEIALNILKTIAYKKYHE